MRKLKYTSIALLLAVLALLPACSMKDAARRVSMELEQVRIRDFSQAGFTAVVYVRVNNPNGYGVTISDFDYHAFVSDHELANGKIEKAIVIPSNGSVVAELPLKADLRSVDPGTMEKMLRGRLGYRVNGAAVFKSWFGSYRYPFDIKERKLEPATLQK